MENGTMLGSPRDAGPTAARRDAVYWSGLMKCRDFDGNPRETFPSASMKWSSWMERNVFFWKKKSRCEGRKAEGTSRKIRIRDVCSLVGRRWWLDGGGCWRRLFHPDRWSRRRRGSSDGRDEGGPGWSGDGRRRRRRRRRRLGPSQVLSVPVRAGPHREGQAWPEGIRVRHLPRHLQALVQPQTPLPALPHQLCAGQSARPQQLRHRGQQPPVDRAAVGRPGQEGQSALSLPPMRLPHGLQGRSAAPPADAPAGADRDLSGTAGCIGFSRPRYSQSQNQRIDPSISFHRDMLIRPTHTTSSAMNRERILVSSGLVAVAWIDLNTVVVK